MWTSRLVTDEYFRNFYELFPTWAPQVQLHDLAHRMDCDGGDPEERRRGLELISSTRKNLSSLPLDLEQRLLQLELEINERLWSSSRHLLPLHQLDHRLFDLLSLGAPGSYQRMNSEEDCEKWFAKIQGLLDWIFWAKENLQQGLRQQITWPKILVPSILAPLRSLGSFSPDQHPLILGLRARASTRLLHQASDWIRNHFYPALGDLIDFIEHQYGPRARDTHGFRFQNEGEALYSNELFRHFGEQVDPDEIHKKGWQAVADLEAKMQELILKHGLHDSEARIFSSGDEALQAYLTVQREVARHLPRFFEHIPSIRCEIREVEAYKAEQAPSAFYMSGNLKNDPPGIFYLNTFNLNRNPRNRTRTLFLHEANPGHHFQISWMKERESDLGMYRSRHYFNGVHAEGWALYAEHLGREMGLFEDPEQLLGHYRDQMLRAARLVVDTGIHHLGWTREKAMSYFQEKVGVHASESQAEIERYMVWPGQALTYYCGFMDFLDLRYRAQSLSGFDLRKFHSQILNLGSVPMSLLKQEVLKGSTL